MPPDFFEFPKYGTLEWETWRKNNPGRGPNPNLARKGNTREMRWMKQSIENQKRNPNPAATDEYFNNRFPGDDMGKSPGGNNMGGRPFEPGNSDWSDWFHKLRGEFRIRLYNQLLKAGELDDFVGGGGKFGPGSKPPTTTVVSKQPVRFTPAPSSEVTPTSFDDTVSSRISQTERGTTFEPRPSSTDRFAGFTPENITNLRAPRNPPTQFRPPQTPEYPSGWSGNDDPQSRLRLPPEPPDFKPTVGHSTVQNVQNLVDASQAAEEGGVEDVMKGVPLTLGSYLGYAGPMALGSFGVTLGALAGAEMYEHDPAYYSRRQGGTRIPGLDRAAYLRDIESPTFPDMYPTSTADMPGYKPSPAAGGGSSSHPRPSPTSSLMGSVSSSPSPTSSGDYSSPPEVPIPNYDAYPGFWNEQHQPDSYDFKQRPTNYPASSSPSPSPSPTASLMGSPPPTLTGFNPSTKEKQRIWDDAHKPALNRAPANFDPMSYDRMRDFGRTRDFEGHGPMVYAPELATDIDAIRALHHYGVKFGGMGRVESLMKLTSKYGPDITGQALGANFDDAPW